MPVPSSLLGRLRDALRPLPVALPALPVRLSASAPDAGRASAGPADRGAPGGDRLSALLARHVSVAVALRVTESGEIEAWVPALPECAVRAQTCEAALGRLRAAVVARLVAGEVGDLLARSHPADAAPRPGCARTQIVIVVGPDAGPLGHTDMFITSV